MIIEMALAFWDNQPKTPLPWAMLDKGLSLMALGKHKVIPFGIVCRLASRVCDIVSDRECRLALRYLCSLGSICFYHNVPGLSDKVFPNTQWVADVVSVFVTILDQTMVALHLWHHLQRLQEEGLMTWDLAKYLLENAGVEEVDYGVILLLLQLFNIASPALMIAAAEAIVNPGDSFFVPCMVAKEYTGHQLAYCSAICSCVSPPPLFLVPKGFSAFLKPLFYRLVSRMVAIYNSKPELTRNQVILHLPQNLELELVYTTRAVIATVYPFDPSQLLSDEVLRTQCVEARVHLVQELTHAKRRGMDGFQFDLSVHPTQREGSPHVVHEALASLEKYPRTTALVNRSGKRIPCPGRLDLWYPDIQEPQPPTVVSRSRLTSGKAPAQSPSRVAAVVSKHGQDQWYSFGCALGFTRAEMTSACHDKPAVCDKLLTLIQLKAEKDGQIRTDEELLEACRNIPSPIYGVVKEILDSK